MSKSMKADKPVTLIYEDPAAALNISDDKWNNIVQENLK